MWIVLVVILLFAAIALLPIHIVIKNDEDGKFKFLVKILGLTFGDKPKAKTKPKDKADNFIVKAVKKALGLNAVEKTEAEQSSKNTKKQSLILSIGDILRIVGNLLTEVKNILRHCTVKKLWLKVRCTGDDAADAAIKYGQLCAVVYPFTALVHSIFKVKEKGKTIDLACDYDGDEGSFLFNIVVSVKFGRVLAAAIKIIFKEVVEAFNKQKN